MTKVFIKAGETWQGVQYFEKTLFDMSPSLADHVVNTLRVGRFMNVLIGCEYSGRVREAFCKLGHNAVSCDFEPAEDGSPYHYQGDLFDVIDYPWDLAIFHPPCTYLTSAGLHWNKRDPSRNALTEEALDFVRKLLALPIPRIALENPVGCISSRIRKPDQIIQPYNFGEDASKATCLWLKGLPLLMPTRRIGGRIVNGRERWANQTDSGQNRLAPSPYRWKERSRTYEGIAAAMAAQWG